MSLGFPTGNRAFGAKLNMRTTNGNLTRSSRNTGEQPRASPSAGKSNLSIPPNKELPIPIRLEVLEIAVQTLSQQIDMLEPASRAEYDLVSPQTDVSGLEERVAALESADGLKHHPPDIGHQLTALGDSVASVSKTLSDTNHTIDNVTASVALHVTGTVCAGGSEFYTNESGCVTTDTQAGSVQLEGGTRVRLVFPQEEIAGKLYMGAVTVDPVSMELRTGWVLIFDNAANKQYMSDFTM